MMTATKHSAVQQQLHEILYLPPDQVKTLFDVVCTDTLESDIQIEKFFVLLTLITGHHAGENFTFDFAADIKPDTGEIFVHQFKFNPGNIWKPSCPMLILLYSAAMNSKLKVFDKNSSPAEFFIAEKHYASEDDLATAVNNWLSKNVVLPEEFQKKYKERLTHRILRRTLASVLNMCSRYHLI